MVARFVRDTVLINLLVHSRTPTNLLTPPLYGDLKNKIHVVKPVLTTCYPTDTGDIEKLNILFRDIAQFGSALRSGRRGRRFKSCYPDQQNLSNQAVSEVFALFENPHFLVLTTIFHLQLWDKVFFFVYTVSNFNTPKSYGTVFFVRAIFVIVLF